MNIDVLPTVADLLGLRAPAAVDGKSFAPTLREGVQETVHDVVFAESFFRQRHLSMAYDGSFQLIRTYNDGTLDASHTDALYAASDWAARRDVVRAHPKEAAALGARLSVWEAAEADKAKGVPLVLAEEDADMRKSLEALGYLESE